jgi:hypothetical protein
MDGPNATPGPSRPRQQAERNSLGLDGHYEEEDRAERLREMEVCAGSSRLIQVSTLEDELFDTPRRNQLQTSQTPDLSKLSSFAHERPHLPRVRSNVPPSLAALDLPSSASASDIFGSVVPPPLTRHTTYSSLPPSPRLADEGSELYARLGKRGLGISELESKLGQLVDDGVDVDEVFWPARSRRGTMEQTERPVLEAREETVAEPSLWDLLKDEAGAEGWEGWAVDGKWERIQNFLAVPLAVERVSWGSGIADSGNAVWRSTMPRRVPLQLYHPAYPSSLCACAHHEVSHAGILHLSNLACAPSFAPADAAHPGPHGHPAIRYRCQQDVSHCPRTRHYQALCHF